MWFIMRILGIGESVIEKTYITEGKEVPVNAAPEIEVGGAVLNAMILLARLKHDCTFYTTLGRDEEAGIIKNKLYKENVYLHCEFNKKTKSSTLLIHPATGNKTKLRCDTKHHVIKNLEPSVIWHYDVFIVDKQNKTVITEIMKHKKPKAIIIDPSEQIAEFTGTIIKPSINLYGDRV